MIQLSKAMLMVPTKTSSKHAQQLVALALLLLCVPAHADRIYRYVGDDGVTVYTNVPPEARHSARAVQHSAQRPTVVSPPGSPPSTVSATNSAPAASNTSNGRRSGYVAIYRYTDENGVTAYTNVRPSGQVVEVLRYYCHACDPRSPVDWNSVALNTRSFVDEVSLAASRHGVDAALVRAVMHAESAFNPQALSHKGAQGLMQLMPATAGMYGVSNAMDAAENIEAGVRHLRYLLDLFNGDIVLATAAYNAGEGAVRRHGGIPPYAETQVYVERVGILHKRYREGLGG